MARTAETVVGPRNSALYAGWRTGGNLGGKPATYDPRPRRITARHRRLYSPLSRRIRRHLPFRGHFSRAAVRWRELPPYVRGILTTGAVVWIYILIALGPTIAHIVVVR